MSQGLQGTGGLVGQHLECFFVLSFPDQEHGLVFSEALSVGLGSLDDQSEFGPITQPGGDHGLVVQDL